MQLNCARRIFSRFAALYSSGQQKFRTFLTEDTSSGSSPECDQIHEPLIFSNKNQSDFRSVPLSSKSVERVVREVFGCRVTTPRIVATGYHSCIFYADTPYGPVQVRVCGPTGAVSGYQILRRQEWCLRQANAAGIPVPAVIGRPERVATVAGLNGVDCRLYYLVTEAPAGLRAISVTDPATRIMIWEQVGYFLRLLHGVPAKGFGQMIDTRGQGFSGVTAAEFLQCAVDYCDSLCFSRAGGIAARFSWKERREALGRIACGPLRASLLHLGVSLGNSYVDSRGNVTFLGGCEHASPGIAPHMEFAALLEGNDSELARRSMPVQQEEKEAFLHGYGIRYVDYDRSAACDARILVDAIRAGYGPANRLRVPADRMKTVGSSKVAMFSSYL